MHKQIIQPELYCRGSTSHRSVPTVNHGGCHGKSHKIRTRLLPVLYNSFIRRIFIRGVEINCENIDSLRRQSGEFRAWNCTRMSHLSVRQESGFLDSSQIALYVSDLCFVTGHYKYAIVQNPLFWSEHSCQIIVVFSCFVHQQRLIYLPPISCFSLKKKFTYKIHNAF